MRVLLVVVIASCAHSSPGVATAPTPAPCPTAPAPPAATAPAGAAAPEWDDAKVIEQSQAFLTASDDYDFAAFEALADAGLVRFGFGRTYDLAVAKHHMQLQHEHHLPAQTRTCKNKRVSRAGASIIYVDVCEVTLTAHEDVPMLTHEESDSIIFTPRNGDWKVVYWGTEPAGVDAERLMWDDVFRSGVHFKTTANQHLIDSVRGRKPGKALDLAMGQGRNAVYLATQGWNVTGIDISEQGMKVAQGNAAKLKVKLETINHDMDTFDYGKNKWDLVTMIYAGNNHALIEKIKPSIRKGGLFVVEFFARESTAKTGIGGFEPGELATLFNDGTWTIATDEVVEDTADWGLAKTKVVRFTAQKK